jgi:hypothetical protein
VTGSECRQLGVMQARFFMGAIMARITESIEVCTIWPDLIAVGGLRSVVQAWLTMQCGFYGETKLVKGIGFFYIGSCAQSLCLFDKLCFGKSAYQYRLLARV